MTYERWNTARRHPHRGSRTARGGISEPNGGKSSAEEVPWHRISEKDAVERTHTGRNSSGGNPEGGVGIKVAVRRTCAKGQGQQSLVTEED